MYPNIIARKLNKTQRKELAIGLSKHNNVDVLVADQHANQLLLNSAKFYDCKNKIEDSEVIAEVLEQAIKMKFS